VIAPIHVQHPISWADEERDLTAWLGNELQDEAYNKLYQMEEKVKAVNDYNLTIDWEYLQTSDHFYYMCTKWFSDGDVHKYFNPYGTPYEAFINYMNVFSDFEIRVNEAFQNINKSEINNLDSDIYIADIPKDNTISDILNISDTKIKSALKKIDSKTISQAVAKANDDLRNKFFINISKKSIKEVESILAKNKFTTKQITEAQRKILKNI